MTITELLLIAVGLSMDAFAVSVCKGLSHSKISAKHYLSAGLYFGGFQALMPFIGYVAGYKFQSVISKFDYIIAFVLLAVIGANMVKEALGDDGEEEKEFENSAMLPLAIATSIDALAVGVTFAALGCGFGGMFTKNIFFNVITIGITTLIISMLGVKIGSVFGTRYKKKSGIAGGAILILIGLRMFVSHFI